MDPKTNHYLHRSATNVLRTSSKPSLQEEAKIVKDIIFPDKKSRIKSAVPHLRNVDSEIIGKNMAMVRFDESTENILTDKQSNKNFLSSKCTAKKRSIHTEAHEYDIANDIRSFHTTASNIDNKNQDAAVKDIVKPTFIDDNNKTRAKIKSSIEEYLQHYCDNIHKSCNIEEEEERCQDVKPSASDIADILASHNIGSQVLYENFEKHSDDSEDYASENDANRSCSNTANNVMQMTPDDSIQENRIRDMSLENTGLYNDTQLTKAVDARFFDIQKQASVTNCQDNAFIKMGLNKNLSRDTLSQILQSEYLKKDLSL